MNAAAGLRARAEALMIGGLIGDDAPDLRRLSLKLYRLLAQGRPVSRQAIAEADELIARIPPARVVWEDGHIVAFGGLSLRPSDHVLALADRHLYTWCVFDGLFLPEIIERPARIESRCPATATAIEIELLPTSLGGARPADPVMSIVAPDLAACAEDLRGVFCRHVRFFVSAAAFRDWAGDSDEITCLSLVEAYDLARQRNALRFADLAAA